MTILTMSDNSKWKPSSSKDVLYCASCSNEVDTPAEIATYPQGNCPQCGSSWTGEEKRSTIIQVTMPESITGGAG
jgi:DNA-directed RNA polymerase subunit RPC12/RpoP